MGPRASDGTVEVGISDHAQQTLGDLVRRGTGVGRALQPAEACAVVESVKQHPTSIPVAGTVIAVNEGWRKRRS